MSPQPAVGLSLVFEASKVAKRSVSLHIGHLSLRLNIRCRFRSRQGVQCPLEVNVLPSGPWFLYMRNDTHQYKCGGVKAYKKGKGLTSGCCPSLKNAAELCMWQRKRHAFRPI